MLDKSRMNPKSTRELPLATGASVGCEGEGIVSILENGIRVFRRYTGTGNEAFGGIVFDMDKPNTLKAGVEQVTVPAGGGVVMLSKGSQIISTSINVLGMTKDADDTPSAANTFSVLAAGGGQIAFNAEDAAKVFTVLYKYEASAQELIEDGVPFESISPVDALGSVGAITEGEIFTDQFDTTADWAAATSVKVGANGQLVPNTGTGVVIPSAEVISCPKAGDPFLGIRF